MINTSEDKVEETIGFLQEKEQKDMERIILRTQKLSTDAMEKERKIENMIEKEEDDKEDFKVNVMKLKYDKVKNGKVINN